jgi:HEAT repeat protein
MRIPLQNQLKTNSNSVVQSRLCPVVSSSLLHLSFWLLVCSIVAGCYLDVPPADPDIVSARLVELLTDPDPDMRRTAAEALGKIGRQSSKAGLVSALHDREARVRAAAALSLGRLGDRESGPALVESLSDPAEVVRRAAALALGEIELLPVSQAQIGAKLRQSDDDGRLAASRALLGLDTVSFSNELVRALHETNSEIRQGVAAVLGETGDVRAVPHLLALLQTDAAAGVRSEAAFRLGKIGDDSVTSELGKIAGTDAEAAVREWARWAIRQIRQSHESGSGTQLSR